MARKVIEICYDLAASDAALHWTGSRPAHAFRDGAACRIGAALAEAGVGRLMRVEDGFGEVRLHMRVTDFEAARRAVCRATSATPYAAFREMLCYWDDAETV